MADKLSARLRAKEALKLLSNDVIHQESQTICKALVNLFDTLRPAVVLGFSPALTEPQIQPFLAHVLSSNIPLFLPKCVDNTYSFVSCLDLNALELGPFSTLQPLGETLFNSDVFDVSLILVPGLAFQKNGQRLGHGNGIYDRLLEKVSGKKVGVCFSSQLDFSWGTEAHDIDVDSVISGI